MWFMRAWCVAGTLQSPCCRTWLTMLPSGVVTAVHGTCSSMTLMCSYAFFMSNIVRTGLLAVRLNMPSMSGRGEVNFTVFLFHSHKSNTVRNWTGLLVLGFGIRSIGTILLAEVIFHCPVFRYASLFSAHCSRNASGHLDGLHGYVFFSLIRGIVWLISLRGGNPVSCISLHSGSAYCLSSSLTSSIFCSLSIIRDRQDGTHTLRYGLSVLLMSHQISKS